MAIKKIILKRVSLLLATIVFTEALLPSVAFALTSGPTQPEVQGFTQAGTSDMVDLFSGDFKYNIPLMDVGGYPINMSYGAGITSDQEASWVGLGWNLNVGVVNRNMRAVPDDFKGDIITKQMEMMPSHTYGITAFPEGELFGIKLGKLNFNAGLKYNNFSGYSFSMGAEPNLWNTGGEKGSLNIGLGLSAGSESGVGITPSLSYSKRLDESVDKEKNVTGGLNGGLSVGFPYSSRGGLKSMTVGVSMDRFSRSKVEEKDALGNTTVKTVDKTTGKDNGSTTISFAGNSYTPSVSMPLMNVNLSLSTTFGGSAAGAHPEVRFMASYAAQFLYQKEKSTPAYGYMYSEHGNKDKNVMHDVNREKDGVYNENITSLPLTNYSYDIYSVNGQGIGGSYRPFRGDIGTVYDVETNNYNAGIKFPGIELGAGGLLHNGINFSINAINTKSTMWSESNQMADALNFHKADPSDKTYEPVYFKQAGDKSADADPWLFTHFGGFEAVRTKINKSSKAAEKVVYNWGSRTEGVITRNKRNGRQRRNEHITLLNADQAASLSSQKQIQIYQSNNFIAKMDKAGYQHQLAVSRLNRPGHHTSEIISYRPDGTRYVFGIPAYNNMQSEVSMNVFYDPTDSDYNTDKESGLTNKSMDPNNKYLDKTITPPFAHGYLLTEVLSADYVDVTGDGPTDDDLGTYTKINYTKIDKNKWRTPYERKNLSTGLNNDKYDDKANYVYGEKEIWYVHSIETKTHVAEFYLEDRADAIPVANEQNGGKDLSAPRLKLLKQIKLFAKKERFNPDNSMNTNAVPIKCVVFEYDYSLCPNIINNSGQAVMSQLYGINGELGSDVNVNGAKGKLTLKKVFFTYGNSSKGFLNPYEFNYAKHFDNCANGDMNCNGVDNNPNYNMRANDRWGNYIPASKIVSSETVYSYEYPYAEQNRTLADKYAASWSLSTVKLPSGGLIKVHYESDDYAYVQDKRAMQMFALEGLSSSAPTSGTIPSDVGTNVFAGLTERDYIYFKLQTPISAINAEEGANIFANKYLRETPKSGVMPFLYFKFLFDIKDGVYDYVPGYLKGSNITSWGVCKPISGEQTWQYGYIRVSEVELDDPIPYGDASPFAHAAWNFTKLYLPRIAYSQPDIDQKIPTIQILQAIGSTLKQIGQTIYGFNNYMRTANRCNTIKPKKSFIRLFSPEFKKAGGGVRVKKIEMFDRFREMLVGSNYQTSSYGQEYDYTSKDGFGNTISSGVASYEPALGGEENPFKQPFAKKDAKLRIPSGEHVQEGPFGETFFPSPSVGYSKVTVKNLQYANVNKTATGKVVHEFYTAKDFPTIVRQTGIEAMREKGNPVFKILSISSIDEMTVSQGYTIELNDMHGKQKGQKVYQQFDDEQPISGVEYKYATDPSDSRRLLNYAHTIDNKGRINKQKELIGYDYDIIADAREQKTEGGSGGLTGNMESFIAAIVPVAVPVVLPVFSYERTRFRSMIMTKVVNQYGIIIETTAFDDKSNIKTENILWDKETGEVLLTKTINNFEDPIYTFNYPAHWVYDGMGQAYKNTNIASSIASLSTIQSLLTKGDEVLLIGQKYWIAEVYPQVKLIDNQGIEAKFTDFDAGDMLEVIRSGRRNQQAVSIGQITCLTNPFTELDNNYYGLDFREVIAAQATEFSDKGDLFCECELEPGTPYNPFLKGTQGNWRSRKAYTYLTGRTQSVKNGNVNTRKDGVFTSFAPFWVYNGNGWGANYINWTFVSEASLYSPYGYSLEDKDALGRYSSAVYGYNHQLPISVAANAKYRETGFDNFEDYNYYDCVNFDRHFSFKKSLISTTAPDFTGVCNLTNSHSHTGRSSIRIKKSETQPGTIKIRKVIEPCPQ